MRFQPVVSLFCLAASLLLVAAFPVRADEIDDAQQLVRQGNLSAALERVNAYLANRPKDARARFLKGVILTEQNKTAEAIKVFTALTEDYPELPEPYNNLAVLYAQQQQYDKARHALEMAIQTHPSYATAHENLGDIYAKLASQAYDRALQLDRNNTAAQTKLALIREIFPINARLQRGVKPEAARPQPAQGGANAKPAAAVAAAPAAVTPTATPPVAKPPLEAAAPPAAEKPAEKPAAAKPAVDATEAAVQTVKEWARAWSAQNVAEYLSFYGPDFRPPKGQRRAEWEMSRRERLTAPKRIQVTVDNLTARPLGDDRVAVTFRQHYRADRLDSEVTKTLIFKRHGTKWLIEQERVGG
jgi:tetratricopeptide (TPR) repeat protein